MELHNKACIGLIVLHVLISFTLKFLWNLEVFPLSSYSMYSDMPENINYNRIQITIGKNHRVVCDLQRCPQYIRDMFLPQHYEFKNIIIRMSFEEVVGFMRVQADRLSKMDLDFEIKIENKYVHVKNFRNTEDPLNQGIVMSTETIAAHD